MNDSSTSRAGAAVAGFFAGGLAGFVATEAVSAFLHFVMDVTVDVEADSWLIAVYVGVPLLTAIAGAFLLLRIASRK